MGVLLELIVWLFGEVMVLFVVGVLYLLLYCVFLVEWVEDVFCYM